MLVGDVYPLRIRLAIKVYVYLNDGYCQITKNKSESQDLVSDSKSNHYLTNHEHVLFQK